MYLQIYMSHVWKKVPSSKNSMCKGPRGRNVLGIFRD